MKQTKSKFWRTKPYLCLQSGSRNKRERERDRERNRERKRERKRERERETKKGKI